MERGLIHVYTGEGKGKTSASIGLCIRALGRNKSVCMVQFLKGTETGENIILKKFEPQFKLIKIGEIKKFFKDLSCGAKKELKNNIEEELNLFKKNIYRFDILILDEIFGVLKNDLLDLEDLIDLIKNKPDTTELVLTGRDAPEAILNLADYVSDISCCKHPYQKGMIAREGIEY
jgi:cob(I)alamin adenosyltransferase